MRPIGFSTGAIAKSDFRKALALLERHRVVGVELSALRLSELAPLVEALPDLDLTPFQFVSFHAPSGFGPDREKGVIGQLQQIAERGIPIVVHPDVIFTMRFWKPLGPLLLIENMDERKPLGQYARDLEPLFESMPEARFCCDIGHARQVDPTMSEARTLLRSFRGRLAEVHISEVGRDSLHVPLSESAISAFQRIANLIPLTTPIVLESVIDQGLTDVDEEIGRAREALRAP